MSQEKIKLELEEILHDVLEGIRFSINLKSGNPWSIRISAMA